MDRFRPNLVVSGCAPHAEDSWQRIRIGDVPFTVAKPCSRCVVVTTDQSTGERHREPLATLSTYRLFRGKVMFGQNLIHERMGSGLVLLGLGSGLVVSGVVCLPTHAARGDQNPITPDLTPQEGRGGVVA